MNRMKRRTTAWAVASVVLLVIGGAAEASRIPLQQVDLLRLEGYVREPRAEDRGTTDLTLDWRGKHYRFQLIDLKVMSGRRLPGDVFSAVSLYRPNFFLYGAEAMRHRLDEAKPDGVVRILGYFRITSRNLMVNEVTLLEPPTPAPSAASTKSS